MRYGLLKPFGIVQAGNQITRLARTEKGVGKAKQIVEKLSRDAVIEYAGLSKKKQLPDNTHARLRRQHQQKKRQADSKLLHVPLREYVVNERLGKEGHRETEGRHKTAERNRQGKGAHVFPDGVPQPFPLGRCTALASHESAARTQQQERPALPYFFEFPLASYQTRPASGSPTRKSSPKHPKRIT